MAENKCLYFFPLRTGTIITGIVFIVIGVVDIAQCLIRRDPDEDLGRFHTIIWIARTTDWVLELGNITLSALLVHGTLQRKERFLVWWLWYIGIVTIMVGILIIGSILMFMAFQMHTEAIVASIILVGGTLLVLHILRAVHGHRIELMTKDYIPTVFLDKVAPPPARESPPRYISLK